MRISLKTLTLTALLVCCSLGIAAQTKSGTAPLTAANALRALSPGINLGNTLEAIPSETAWGNPKTSKAWFQGVRKAGFKSVRIPAAWTQYSDKDHKISKVWMARVTQVVKDAIDSDLYVMLNVHWDGGWLQPTPAAKGKASHKLSVFWDQIARNFEPFGDKLIFAGTNETGVEGEYGTPKQENADIQNSFNQVFVDTVRKTGGRNKNRWLAVQAYNTNIDHAAKFNSVMPRDSVKGRLMMEVHHYSPYNFALNEKSDIWQWGKGATDPKATETWANEEYTDAQFALMKKTFVDKGVPVILGEYCAGLKKRFPGMRKYQMAWNEYVTRSAFNHGVIPMLWDVGYETGMVSRTTGKVQDAEMIKLLVNACR